jgi:hypothetical protein
MSVSVLVLSLGLHWALLQTVAWTGMLIRFSAQDSIKDAVSKTFDGKHPCALCKVVTQGRAEEKKQEQQQVKSDSKLDYGLIWQQTDFIFASAREETSSLDTFGLSRREEPPKPRPRSIPEDSLARA